MGRGGEGMVGSGGWGWMSGGDMGVGLMMGEGRKELREMDEESWVKWGLSGNLFFFQLFDTLLEDVMWFNLLSLIPHRWIGHPLALASLHERPCSTTRDTSN